VANLYAIGWRQGSFVEAELPAAGFTLDDHAQVGACSGTHRTWVVASQDCDLNGWETTRTEPLVELRTRITAKDPDTEWGIRSRVVRLTETEGVHSDSAPLRISPVARRWLTEVGMAVPDRLGVLGGIDAGYRSETSLELIESSYSADLSGLSWPGPDPHGAL